MRFRKQVQLLEKNNSAQIIHCVNKYSGWTLVVTFTVSKLLCSLGQEAELSKARPRFASCDLQSQSARKGIATGIIEERLSVVTENFLVQAEATPWGNKIDKIQPRIWLKYNREVTGTRRESTTYMCFMSKWPLLHSDADFSVPKRNFVFNGHLLIQSLKTN